jgi:hypothetical protein
MSLSLSLIHFFSSMFVEGTCAMPWTISRPPGIAYKSLRLLSDFDREHSSSRLFTSSFALGASVVDPLVTAMRFINVVFEYRIFSNETTVKVAERAARSVINHSAVYFSQREQHFCLQDASLRFRPNGEDLRCHNQPAEYVRRTSCRDDHFVIFRCTHPEHDGCGPHGRKFRVTLLKDDPPLRQFLGGQPRLLMTAI